MRARAVVYEHGPLPGVARLAEELAACVHARLVPVLAGHGARRRARRLSAAAAREDAVFLVVSSHGEVLRSAPCPVAIVPPRLAGARPPMLAGDHILWAVGDQRDARIAAAAAGIADAVGLPVTVAHVLSGDRQDPAAERLAAWFADGLLERLAAHGPALDARAAVRLRRGEPGPELAILAAEENSAMIVTGCRGFVAVRASVSAYLARHCPAPVVVVPAGASEPVASAHGKVA